MSPDTEAKTNANGGAGPEQLRAALAGLREAYIDLESTAPLRDIGRSSAFINHEIKNYMMVISGYATLLQRSKTMSDKDRAMVNNIAQTAAKLQEFNMTILEMSKPKAAPGVEEFDLMPALAACADANFPGHSSAFSISCDSPNGEALINGNRGKLERAFASAFRNSFEAGAQKISVKVSVSNFIALISIEDDGKGCDAEQLPKLSETFFTSKQNHGMGLGLCILRSIVEAHNGCLNIYSKNLLGGGEHGLSVQIMIPTSKRTPSASSKSEAMLVKEGLSDPNAMLKIMKNLKIVPRIAETASGVSLAEGCSHLKTVVLAAAQLTPELAAKAAGNKDVKIVAIEEAGDCKALFATDMESGEGKRELFTEEFVVRHLCG